MALAVVGETCSITFDGADHRCYQFDLSKTGSRVSVKAFVDGVGVNPEIVTGTGKELTCKFYDDVTETFVLNTVYSIVYDIGDSTPVSGYWKCMEISNTTPAAGIADFTAIFKSQATSA
jgi:hypothetical protein